MMNLEFSYRILIRKILDSGYVTKGRNGNTISLFGKNLEFDVGKRFPLITGRKIYYKGVLGEMAAFLRGPKSVKDFEDWGCNYWKLWGDKDGNLDVDYGNQWLDFNGVNQVDKVIEGLKNNPYSRRHIIAAWRPDRLDQLSLPCCHYNYQFNVSGDKLDLLFSMRSVDVAIGLPSDIVLAGVMLMLFANEVDLIPSKVYMSFGNAHIYEEHIKTIHEYLETPILSSPTYEFNTKNIYDFKPDDVIVNNYKYSKKLKFLLKE